MKLNPAYLEDASGLRGHADAVYIPTTEAEISELLKQASSERIPVTIAGAGTGVAGGRVPSGGWVISLEKFRQIEIEDGRAKVGAGVLLRDLQSQAQMSGQFYAPDPTETAASIGGTIATNASGSRSFRYGDTRRHVLGLRVILADGSIQVLNRGEAASFDFAEVPPPNTTKHSAGFYLRRGMDLSRSVYWF
ncbi:MAG: FAD-binding oxidoreductase [Bryobacteraceae bacterium]